MLTYVFICLRSEILYCFSHLCLPDLFNPCSPSRLNLYTMLYAPPSSILSVATRASSSSTCYIVHYTPFAPIITNISERHARHKQLLKLNRPSTQMVRGVSCTDIELYHLAIPWRYASENDIAGVDQTETRFLDAMFE